MTNSQWIGIGLRHPHYKEVFDKRPPVGWLEVHAENYFYNKGPSEALLLKVRDHYGMSLHGVGLSLGSDLLCQQHLSRLKRLVDKTCPFLVSEHLSWNRVGKIAVPDLLPIPYHQESLEIFANNIEKTQDWLQREILIENPSSYLEFQQSDIPESAFLTEICQQSGAKILLDVNNIFVSCQNHGWDAKEYIDAIPENLVKEIHIAGHSFKTIDQHTTLRVDTHDNFVCDEVWSLYEMALQRFGKTPTLLEWDANIPSLDVLTQEALKAEPYLAASDEH